MTSFLFFVWPQKQSSCFFVFTGGKSQIQTFFHSQSHSSHSENNGVKTSLPKF